MSERRPKRRCVAAKTHVPSAIHYVGYVEDEETPEMIMKKFEELERIQKAAEAKRQQQHQQQQPNADGAAPSGATALPSGPPHNPQPSSTVAAVTGGAGVDYPCATANGSHPADGAGPSAAHHSPALPCEAQHAQHGTVPSQQPQDSQHERLLDEEALLEVFKQTSIFNVRSTLSNNELLSGGPGDGLLGAGAGGLAGRHDPYSVAFGMEDALFVGGEPGGAGSDVDEMDEMQCMKGFWSDEDYELGGGSSRNRDGAAGRSKRKGHGAGGKPGGGAGGAKGEGGDGSGKGAARAGSSSGPSRHAAHQMVTQYNRDTNALIRRRVAASGGGGGPGGGSALVQLRVPPPPLPLSWGRTVQPYQPPAPYQRPSSPARPPPAQASSGVTEPTGAGGPAAAADAAAEAAPAPATLSRGFESADLSSFAFADVLGGKTYVAVMVNMGWQPPGAAEAFEDSGEGEVMRRLRKLPIPRLCPRGFVLVWAHKGLLQAVCRALAAWGYVYVENLTWVHLTPANAIATQQGRHFRRSHSTLLMFRREGEGRDIELRHQRNPDVLFDCIRCLPGSGAWDIPAEVLTTIETMLPGGKGSFLELWAPRGARRPGWDHVCEVRPAAPSITEVEAG